jgi:Dolichyl-phosphate-mannose-protein mannosyltransferase
MTFAKKLLTPNKWEYVVPALAVASLLISCILVSEKKFFWNDELYSYYLLADRSFTHMLGAFHDKINNTPPLYFILGWLWARAFGSTELSLRLFSSLGMCIACVTVWVTLRRTYNFWSASIGTLSVFCTSELILSQNAEARMYGLFMAVCSFALLLFDINNSSSKSSRWIICSNACIHAAMVHTHLFGLFYSGAILCSHIVIDRYLKIFRPKLYLSIVLSWISLILYIPSFLNQADAGNPRTWIPIPVLKDLIDLLIFTPSSFLKLVILPLLILVSGLSIIFYKTEEPQTSEQERQNQQNLDAEKHILIFSYAFIVVPVLIWIISRTVKPIFIDRYMIPSTISWSILLSYLCSRIVYNIAINFLAIAQKVILLLALTAVLLVYPITYANSLPKAQLPGLNDNKYGHKDLPIVVQSSHDFLQRLQYSPYRNRYFFILDWQAAVDSSSGLFPTQEYKHLKALKRNYPELFQNITKSGNFINKYQRFLVLDDVNYTKKCKIEPRWENISCPRWLEMRILNNPTYKVKALGKIEFKKNQMLLIEKIEK